MLNSLSRSKEIMNILPHPAACGTSHSPISGILAEIFKHTLPSSDILVTRSGVMAVYLLIVLLGVSVGFYLAYRLLFHKRADRYHESKKKYSNYTFKL
jgi:hypothetical protein